MKLYTASNLFVKYVATLTFPDNAIVSYIVKIANTALDALIFILFHIKLI